MRYIAENSRVPTRSEDAWLNAWRAPSPSPSAPPKNFPAAAANAPRTSETSITNPAPSTKPNATRRWRTRLQSRPGAAGAEKTRLSPALSSPATAEAPHSIVKNPTAPASPPDSGLAAPLARRPTSAALSGPKDAATRSLTTPSAASAPTSTARTATVSSTRGAAENAV